MRATVIISKRLGSDSYMATASDKFGGGYQGASAGNTPSDAAAFAVREMIAYAQRNAEGGDLMAPEEVMALVPEHLRSIKSH